MFTCTSTRTPVLFLTNRDACRSSSSSLLLLWSTTTTTLLLLSLFLLDSAQAFEWSVGPHRRPEVTRQAIAGLWRLSQQPLPLKEFTVKATNDKTTKQQQQTELLLMLKEDGSFQQYLDEDDDDDDDDNAKNDKADVDASWRSYQEQQQQKKTEEQQSKSKAGNPAQQPPTNDEDWVTDMVRGVWDFRDGKLMLAADRPKSAQQKQKKPAFVPRPSMASPFPRQDKLLVGRVVATYQQSLSENPVLQQQQQQLQPSNTTVASMASSEEETSPATPASSTGVSTASPASQSALDTRLSVPRGSLKLGRFFYPKSHPSFFENPIYNPQRKEGACFTLRQVLGTLNTASAEEEQLPVYERRDFYNKTFVLTSHPNKYVSRKRKEQQRQQRREMDRLLGMEPNRTIDAGTVLREGGANIRVMLVRFFTNNTFATVWGTGDNILRGKFDVWLSKKDPTQHHFWMQVTRFGFGRSVSGSVYSEGRTLTQDDAKSYWGSIREQKDNETLAIASRVEAAGESDSSTTANPRPPQDDAQSRRLEVKGAVMFGGHQPTPVGQFLMREATEDEMTLCEDDEDEDDDEDEEVEIVDPELKRALLDAPTSSVQEGVDWENMEGFQ